MNEEGCELCQGRGWIVDLATNRARRCTCHAARVRSRRLDDLGVPLKYQGCRLTNFRLAGDVSDQLLNARRDCDRYIEEFMELDGSLNETGLMFIGPSGRGKTHLAVAVLMELAEQYGVRGRFVDFTSLVAEIQATFQSDATRHQDDLLRPLHDADVVVVDELGARRPSPFVSDTLYLLINGRYMARRPTLFTSNYHLTAGADGDSAAAAGSLTGRVPASLISRLHQMAKPILIDAVGDYRHELQAHQHR